MKRIGTIICLSIMMIMVTASVLPLTGVANAQSKLSVKEIAPKDKETGMALENLGFKVYCGRQTTRVLTPPKLQSDAMSHQGLDFDATSAS